MSKQTQKQFAKFCKTTVEVRPSLKLFIKSLKGTAKAFNNFIKLVEKIQKKYERNKNKK